VLQALADRGSGPRRGFLVTVKAVLMPARVEQSMDFENELSGIAGRELAKLDRRGDEAFEVPHPPAHGGCGGIADPDPFGRRTLSRP
jgi:hypothetical protein